MGAARSMSWETFSSSVRRRDEVVDALVDGESGIAEGHGCCGLDLLVGGWWRRRLRGGLSGCGERQKEDERKDGWTQAHGNDSPEEP